MATQQTERLGRYQLLDSIGSGPCGTVSRAKVFGVAGFERQFAVKRFSAELTAAPAQAQALSAAARAYGSLEHPRIARMSEFGVAQGTTFTAVELVTGLDAMRLVAEAKLAGATLAVGGSLALVSQAARAVGYAHGRGLSHLGLSPTNVLVTAEGDIKITDFGILASTLPQRPLEAPRIAQRLQYLAPEQLANEATSAATDVWALGVLAYELVTGNRTFRGETPAQVAQSVMSGAVPEPALPRPILRVLQRCLARSPFERFPDARALADALDAAIRVAPVPGTRKDIGAQVKTTLDRVASQNDGALSGMLALHVGTGPGPRLDSIAQLGRAEPGDGRDSRPSHGDVSTTEFVRPDTPVAGPAPLVGPRSGSPVSPAALAGAAAPGGDGPITTLRDMPVQAMMTVPGLAPPPIPVPSGIGAPSPTTPPATSSVPDTLLGIANQPKSPAPPGQVPPRPVLGAVPPPARPPTKVPAVAGPPPVPKFRENHTPPPIPTKPPPAPPAKPALNPTAFVRPRIDTPPPLPAAPGNTPVPERIGRPGPEAARPAASVVAESASDRTEPVERPSDPARSGLTADLEFDRVATAEHPVAAAPKSLVNIQPKRKSFVADFDAGIYLDDDDEVTRPPQSPDDTAAAGSRRVSAPAPLTSIPATVETPAPAFSQRELPTEEMPPLTAGKLAHASTATTGELAPLVAEADRAQALIEFPDEAHVQRGAPPMLGFPDESAPREAPTIENRAMPGPAIGTSTILGVPAPSASGQRPALRTSGLAPTSPGIPDDDSDVATDAIRRATPPPPPDPYPDAPAGPYSAPYDAISYPEDDPGASSPGIEAAIAAAEPVAPEPAPAPRTGASGATDQWFAAGASGKATAAQFPSGNYAPASSGSLAGGPPKKRSKAPFIIAGCIVAAVPMYFYIDWLTTHDDSSDGKRPGGKVAGKTPRTPGDGSVTNAIGDNPIPTTIVDAAPPIDAPPDAPPKPVDLSITSTPAGARVFIDGSDAGVTPIKIAGSNDKHNIGVFLAGHELYVAQVDGHGNFPITLKEVTPSAGEAGIKVIQCKVKERYYVFVDGKPTGQTCPTERIETPLGPHVVEVYDLVSETRRKWDINITDTRLSYRVRIDPQ